MVATSAPTRYVPAGTTVTIRRGVNPNGAQRPEPYTTRVNVPVPETARPSSAFPGQTIFEHMGFMIRVADEFIVARDDGVAGRDNAEYAEMMAEKAAEQRAEIESERAAYRAEMERDAAAEAAIMAAEMANARPDVEPDFGAFEPAPTPAPRVTNTHAPRPHAVAGGRATAAARCRRCGGSGRLYQFGHVENGRCFRCGGSGRAR